MRTENILTWLDRRKTGGPGTPRRLVIVLPQHDTPDQAAAQARTLLADRGLTGDVALHVLRGESDGEWREDMHKPAIVIGTADLLLARVLLRGFDISRVNYPIDFALLTNGAHWIIAEPRLCPQTAVTLTRLAQFAKLYGTAEPFTVTGIDSLEEERARVLARSDFVDLFDTGTDADIVPYVCDGDELDAEVVWSAWTPTESGAPHPDIGFPPVENRCRTPLSEVAALAQDHHVYRRDQGEWVPLAEPARPYEVLLVHDPDGPELGPPEVAESTEKRPWQSLDDHSEQVRDQAEALLSMLSPDLPPGAARSAVIAGYLHDAGKAHEIWQDALCALALDDEKDDVTAGRPWAKSGTTGRLEFRGGVSFRHELGSLLFIDGPLRDLLAESPDPDLTRYLVLAHHGKLRLQVRDPDAPGDQTILGLRQGETTGIPPVFGHPATVLTTDLTQFAPGGEWSRTTQSLLDRYGPFTLAYLETLVRIADWRASGAREFPA